MTGHSALNDIDPETFRKYGHQVIDWIADYMANIDEYPVLSQVSPGDIKAQLPANPPAGPESLDDILADYDNIIMPGITHWNHPGFMAYFCTSGSVPGILGELLTAALNVNGMLWKTSPAATELEEVTLDWLRQMLGLPEQLRGVITDGASMSSALAIAAARGQLPFDIRKKGLSGRPEVPRLRLYTSEQAHSSIEKGAITMGIGQEGVRKIALDADFRMDVSALARAIEEDKANGWYPFFVCATTGTTATTSIDPLPAIADICRQYDLWLHVDGAYGGTAAIVPEFRYVLDGAEHADSLVVNPHKWMFTPVDCSALYLRDPQAFKGAFSLVPEYLRTGQSDVNNYMDWGIQLGRRFRALKLWMVIRAFGHEGLAARVREHIRLAQDLAQWVDAHPDFERMAPTPLSTVCLRACPQRFAADESDEANTYLNDLNMRLMDAVNASGKAYISHTILHGRVTLRIAIGNLRTTEAHVRQAWALLGEHAARLDGV